MPHIASSSIISRLLFTILSLATYQAGAQQGPPPEVQKAVAALMEVIDGDDDAIRAFIDLVADPDWVARDGRPQVLDRLRTLRGATRGAGGEVEIEPAPDGVIVLFGDGPTMRRIEMKLSANGVSGLKVGPGGAQVRTHGDRDAAVRAHVAALERSGEKRLDEVVSAFENEHFSADLKARMTAGERRALLATIRSAAAEAGAVMLDERDGEVRLTLRGRDSLVVVFGVAANEPFAIESLRTEDADADLPALSLTWENADQSFADLERKGFAGVVHLSRDGNTVLQRAYGKSNRELGFDTRLDTIFGIGSTPIDFTVTGVHLLEQQRKLDLDDAIGTYFDAVPADKSAMTLRHLISGQSGLPDFHGIPEQDWDLDLAWINRDTAVARILAQPLLFAPGSGRAHSHSAYGLVAAVIEIVSGQDYHSFIRDQILVPAGMTRTGMYGQSGGFGIRDFAVGYGPSSVGVPNIPPNWGPTSWLVMGSGGMYSTIGDMLNFYRYVRSGKALRKKYARRYLGDGVGIGGSDRGFYFFHAYRGRDHEVMMLMNGEGRAPEIRALSRALEKLVTGDE